ncbi:uncharacterized protein fam83e isoform X1 [Lepisosteus oculatus]|uniref:uncharacterized protein fam83e isoform X1 n=1 Tax=Lepisosteus oculatus TaxID=7918 RepID=UPI00371C2457
MIGVVRREIPLGVSAEIFPIVLSANGMSNSQEQSLNEDAEFLPITESSPEFHYSEPERRALESLLSAGPGAFHTKLSLERLGPFLSPEEVAQIDGWAQDYRHSEVQLENEGGEGGEDLARREFSVSYWPQHTDVPAPSLEMGWPENGSWKGIARATVYTSPPTQGAPQIREVVRKLIQGASKVVAVVTDKLTDNVVIADLLGAADRGTPVYIILNRRGALGHCTLSRLKHQNMRVRVLGGNTFCSRDGKVVTGELKDNFILVDLETVVLGSYSLTWTDAHLHRQLVTVLNGEVVESFDNEFRTLYASSLPLASDWEIGEQPYKPEGPFPYPEYKAFDHATLLGLDNLSHLSTPPCSDCPLNWEELGVKSLKEDGFLPDGYPIIQQESQKESEWEGLHVHIPPSFERRAPVGEELSSSKEGQDLRFSSELDKSKKPDLQNKDLQAAPMKHDPKESDVKNAQMKTGPQNSEIQKAIDACLHSQTEAQSSSPPKYRRHNPWDSNLQSTQSTRLRSQTETPTWSSSYSAQRGKPKDEPLANAHVFNPSEGQSGESPNHSREVSAREDFRARSSSHSEEEVSGLRQFSSRLRRNTLVGTALNVELAETEQTRGPDESKKSQPSHTGASSSLSDILKGLQARRSSLAQPVRGARTAVPGASKSMWDLSQFSEDGLEKTTSFRLSQAKRDDPYHLKVTPALAIMRQRGDDTKNGILSSLPKSRTPNLPSFRHRSTSFSFMQGWKKVQTDQENVK